jgi:hypothetical protein
MLVLYQALFHSLAFHEETKGKEQHLNAKKKSLSLLGSTGESTLA